MNQPEQEFAIVVPIEEVKPRAAGLKWWIIAPLGVLLMPCLVFGIAKIPVVEQFVLSKTGDSTAIYDGFEFAGTRRFSARPNKLTVPIYVQLPNGNRYLLKDLPEEEVAKILRKGASSTSRLHVYTDFHSFIKYLDGELNWFSVITTTGEFGISPAKEGPYLMLPVDRQDVLKTFGQPIRWEPYDPGVRSP